MKLRVLDGGQSIGGTKLYLEDRGSGVLLDFGLNYSEYGSYFEEFMRPRSARGLRDLWELELIPRVKGMYRDDLFPPDFAPRSRESLRPDALLVSHAHMDHIGMAGVLREDLPLVTSPISAAIMKALQDTGKGDPWTEFAYSIPKVASSTDSRALCSSGTATPAQARPLHVFGEASDALRSLWNSPPNPSSRARSLQPAPIQEHTVTVAGMKLTAHPLDHSIPGCTGCILETSEGPVVYPGDLRLHGCNGAHSLAFVEEMVKQTPLLLLCEGTRLSRGSHTIVTEADVATRINEIVSRSSGRLIFGDFGGRHVERLRAFAAAARMNNRRLVITSKDAYLLEAIQAADPSSNTLDDDAICVYDKFHARMEGWEQALRQRLQGRYVSSLEVRQDPGAYVLAFSYWDCGEFIDLSPDRGVYIYAGSEAYSADQRSSMWRLTQWLQRWRMRLYGFEWEGDANGRPLFNDRLNSSGHIGAAELAWMINEIKPEYVLPIHTTEPQWFSELLSRSSSKVLAPSKGGLVTCL